MPGLYYSFDHGGWHFVVLNNFRVHGENFIAEYDEEQLEFLRRDLTAANGRSTMIFAHYPAVSAIEFFDGNAEPKDEAWSLSFDRTTRNPQALSAARSGVGRR
jgi:Icc protein